MFLKKKATVLDIATALLRFAPGAEEDAASLIEGLPEGVDHKKVLHELVYLKIFVVDFAVTMTLVDNQLKNEVLDTYQVFLDEMAKESIIGLDAFRREGKDRLHTYADAVKTPHHLGQPWTVGKAFSDLCGTGMDLHVITTGSIIFGTIYAAVSDLVKSVKIVH